MTPRTVLRRMSPESPGAPVGDASQQALVGAGDFTVTSTAMAMPFDGPHPRPEGFALLPDGLDTDGHRFWVGEAHGRRVGTIWLDLRRPYGFVYNVVVDEGARGHRPQRVWRQHCRPWAL